MLVTRSTSQISSKSEHKSIKHAMEIHFLSRKPVGRNYHLLLKYLPSLARLLAELIKLSQISLYPKSFHRYFIINPPETRT